MRMIRPATGTWVLLILVGAASPVQAQWTAKGDVGASLATGNSENTAANANLDLKYTQ